MSFQTSFNFRSGAPDIGVLAETITDRPESEVEAQFRAAADRQHRRLAQCALCGVAGIPLVGVSLLVPDALMKWVAVPGSVLIGLSLLLFFTLPALHCPSCRLLADGGVDRHCPSCGGEQLQKHAVRGTRCGNCGRTLGSTKYRNYTIRFCTHCGIRLSAAGA